MLFVKCVNTLKPVNLGLIISRLCLFRKAGQSTCKRVCVRIYVVYVRMYIVCQYVKAKTNLRVVHFHFPSLKNLNNYRFFIRTKHQCGQGCNARKVNCSFVYSAYILKPVCKQEQIHYCSFSIRDGLEHLILIILIINSFL